MPVDVYAVVSFDTVPDLERIVHTRLVGALFRRGSPDFVARTYRTSWRAVVHVRLDREPDVFVVKEHDLSHKTEALVMRLGIPHTEPTHEIEQDAYSHGPFLLFVREDRVRHEFRAAVVVPPGTPLRQQEIMELDAEDGAVAEPGWLVHGRRFPGPPKLHGIVKKLSTFHVLYRPRSLPVEPILSSFPSRVQYESQLQLEKRVPVIGTTFDMGFTGSTKTIRFNAWDVGNADDERLAQIARDSEKPWAPTESIEEGLRIQRTSLRDWGSGSVPRVKYFVETRGGSGLYRVVDSTAPRGPGVATWAAGCKHFPAFFEMPVDGTDAHIGVRASEVLKRYESTVFVFGDDRHGYYCFFRDHWSGLVNVTDDRSVLHNNEEETLPLLERLRKVVLQACREEDKSNPYLPKLYDRAHIRSCETLCTPPQRVCEEGKKEVVVEPSREAAEVSHGNVQWFVGEKDGYVMTSSGLLLARDGFEVVPSSIFATFPHMAFGQPVFVGEIQEAEVEYHATVLYQTPDGRYTFKEPRTRKLTLFEGGLPSVTSHVQLVRLSADLEVFCAHSGPQQYGHLWNHPPNISVSAAEWGAKIPSSRKRRRTILRRMQCGENLARTDASVRNAKESIAYILRDAINQRLYDRINSPFLPYATRLVHEVRRGLQPPLEGITVYDLGSDDHNRRNLVGKIKEVGSHLIVCDGESCVLAPAAENKFKVAWIRETREAMWGYIRFSNHSWVDPGMREAAEKEMGRSSGEEWVSDDAMLNRVHQALANVPDRRQISDYLGVYLKEAVKVNERRILDPRLGASGWIRSVAASAATYALLFKPVSYRYMIQMMPEGFLQHVMIGTDCTVWHSPDSFSPDCDASTAAAWTAAAAAAFIYTMFPLLPRAGDDDLRSYFRRLRARFLRSALVSGPTWLVAASLIQRWG